MAYFQHVATRSDGPATHAGGIAALALHSDAGGVRVYSANGLQGGLVARDLLGGLAVVDHLAHGPLGGRPGTAHLEVATLGGRPALLSYGAGAGVRGHWLDGPDDLGPAFALPVPTQTALAVETLALGGGRDLVLTSGLGLVGVVTALRGPAGALTPIDRLTAGMGTAGADILDIEAIARPGGGLALILSAQTGQLSAYRLDAVGRATLADTLGNADGLAVAAPNLLETLRLGGRDIVLVGAAGTGSITVVEAGADGRLRVLDQVNDDLSTRFQRISVLESVVVGDRVLVVAGGGDDGLSLMTLLPGGRLLHLESLADTPTTRLANVAALSLRAAGGGIDVVVAGGGEAGVTHLRVDLGPLAPVRAAGRDGGPLAGDARGDLLMGGGGDDRLDGRAGDDILVDGAGTDQITGGPGRDVFVLVPDGEFDRIADFRFGEDRVDLSAWGRIYGPGSLGFFPIAGGVEIRHGDERLQLLSGDGTAIPWGRLTAQDLVDLWHVGPVALPDPSRTILGTPFPDALLGKHGNDLLVGRAGADVLRGGGGADVLLGEDRDVAFDAAAAQVYRLFQATLGRAPEAAGHLAWVETLQGPATLTGIAAAFVGSTEFRATYGATTDAAFVRLLFVNVLGRPPAAAGLEAWTDRLAGGESRAAVVAGFAESAEFAALTAAGALGVSRAGHQAMWADDVYRLYRATLDRAPNEAGLLAFTAALAQGRDVGDVVLGFTGSAEFRARYGATTDAGFVRLLYDNVLGRAPLTAGLLAWTDALASGRMTRPEVVEAFAQSPEFVAATAGDLKRAILAMGLDDRLDGGPGRDVLFGGLGADVFVFRRGDGGAHRVAGLEPWDRIELAGYGLASGAQARGLLRDAGDDVTLALPGLHLTLVDVEPAEVTADMFLV